MKQFATYEEENIHYWTNRASGYSTVNQEELFTAASIGMQSSMFLDLRFISVT